MAEKPFRVLLDLTDLHIDSIKYVWINVSPRELKTIADFKSNLLHKINLARQDVKLFVKDGLLLDEETIIVLRENDTVKVKYEKLYNSFQDQNYSTKRHKSKKRAIADTEDTPLIAKLHKRKRNTSADNTDEHCLEDQRLKTKKRHKKLGNSTSPLALNNSETVEDSQNSLTVNNAEREKHSKRSIENNMDMNVLENSSLFVSFETQDSTVKKCQQSSSCKIDLTEKPSCSMNVSSIESLSNGTLTINDIGTNLTESKVDMNSFTKSSNNCPKKKRKRHRKRKKEPELITINTPDDTNFNEYKSFIQDDSNKSSKRKHVVYSDASPYVQHFESDTIKLVNLEDSDGNNKDVNNSSTYVVSEVGSNVTTQLTDSYPKVSTPAQSNGCIEPSWQVSLMQNEKLNPIGNKSSQSSNKEEITNRYFRRNSYKEILAEMNPCDPPLGKIAPLNSMPEVGTHIPYKKNTQSSNERDFRTRYSGRNSSKDATSEMNSWKPSYEDFPPLNAMPEVGTYIAYKVLELNENYSPEVSEYKEGKIKSIDPKTEEIEIELLYHEIRPGRTGKFENLKEDEEPAIEHKTKDIVKWSLLIEPKLIPSSK